MQGVESCHNRPKSHQQICTFMPHLHAIFSCHIFMSHFHVTFSRHIFMPHFHATSSCHIFIPHLHATFSCHIFMPQQLSEKRKGSYVMVQVDLLKNVPSLWYSAFSSCYVTTAELNLVRLRCMYTYRYVWLVSFCCQHKNNLIMGT
jgi:hypothetical protein